MTTATRAIRVSERGYRRLRMITARTDESMYEVIDRLLALEEVGELALRRLESLNSEETGPCRATRLLRKATTARNGWKESRK